MCDVLINAGHNDTSLELDFSDLFPQFAVRNLENNAEVGGGRESQIDITNVSDVQKPLETIKM